VNIRFAKLSKLKSRGKVNENNFTYYLGADSVKGGLGYQFLRFKSLKTVVKLPIGIVYGLEGKVLFYESMAADSTTSTETFGHLGIPVGVRGLINMKGIVIAPDLHYMIALASPSASENKASYLVAGGTVRWKFVYGGVNLNMGKSVNFLGFRAGLSF
jgi:hypothetical protein